MSALNRLARRLGGPTVTHTVPDDLRYTDDHEWVRHEGDRLRVGITHFAQDALGDVVYVDLPPVGAVFQFGDTCGEIESTKSVSDLYAPADGTVIAVNEALTDDPALVNRDPYGDGWLCLIEATPDHNRLLDPETYRGRTGASA